MVSHIIHGTKQILKKKKGFACKKLDESNTVLWSMVGVSACNVEPWPSDSKKSYFTSVYTETRKLICSNTPFLHLISTRLGHDGKYQAAIKYEYLISSDSNQMMVGLFL